jgi:UrcA family protein
LIEFHYRGMRAMITKLLPAAVSAALVTVLFSFQPVPAYADEAVEEEVVDRIRVVAPRVTRTQTRVGRYDVEMAELSEYVDFPDLDLTRTADLFELQERVHEAATEICTHLADMYTRGTPTTETCIRRAVDDASVLVEAAARAAIER